MRVFCIIIHLPLQDATDSSERLYLPLNKTNPDCSTYTCVAANPVSTQTTQLDITELCYEPVSDLKAEEVPESAVLIPAGLIVALSVLFLLYWTKTCKQQVYQYVKLNYTEVKSTSQYSEEAHKKGSAGVTEDQRTLVVYSAIRT
ncbi:hypothetical protein SRHO_G00254070 [Serrasalmus rhombeus]